MNHERRSTSAHQHNADWAWGSRPNTRTMIRQEHVPVVLVYFEVLPSSPHVLFLEGYAMALLFQVIELRAH